MWHVCNCDTELLTWYVILVLDVNLSADDSIRMCQCNLHCCFNAHERRELIQCLCMDGCRTFVGVRMVYVGSFFTYMSDLSQKGSDLVT